MLYGRRWKPSKAEAKDFKETMLEIEVFCRENGIDKSLNGDSYFLASMVRNTALAITLLRPVMLAHITGQAIKFARSITKEAVIKILFTFMPAKRVSEKSTTTL